MDSIGRDEFRRLRRHSAAAERRRIQCEVANEVRISSSSRACTVSDSPALLLKAAVQHKYSTSKWCWRPVPAQRDQASGEVLPAILHMNMGAALDGSACAAAEVKGVPAGAAPEQD